MMDERIPELHRGDRVGAYEILEEIGRGHFGLRAYLARHRLIDRQAVVLLSLTQDETIRRLVHREAEILASISHPHLVGLYDVGEHEGHVYQVQEYVSGRSLGAMIRSGDHLPLATVTRLMTYIADALDHLHERGYVHGEVQPGHIMVSSEGVPVLLSSVKMAPQGEDDTSGGVVLGRAPYLPPEAWQGRQEERSDLWALGMTLHFLLVGRTPLRDEDRLGARDAILSPAPLDLSALDYSAPEPLSRIVRHCLEKDLARRYQSAADVRRDLESALAYLESRSSGTSPAPLKPGRAIWLNVDYAEPGIVGQFREYYIDRQVGAGAFSNVYSAKDVIGRRPVALKILRQERLDQDTVLTRFQREAALLARLRHPNVVQVHNYGLYGRDHFIVMELLENLTLEMALEDNGPFSTGEAVAVTAQILAGLQAIHSEGVVHRDLKPANVILAPDRAVVMDLGLAHVSGGSTLTTLGQVLGTPSYMAPEQARGEPVTNQSDLYSASTILYEMLTGELPHGAGSPGELIFRIALEAPDPVTRHRSDLPPALVTFLHRALAREPGERHDSASLAREELLASIGLRHEELPQIYQQMCRDLGSTA